MKSPTYSHDFEPKPGMFNTVGMLMLNVGIGAIVFALTVFMVLYGIHIFRAVTR